MCNDSIEETKRESHIKWNMKPKRRPHTPSQDMFFLKRVTQECHKWVTRTRMPQTRTRQGNPRQGQDPEMLCESPQGGQGKRAALSHSTLGYFKHYDFIVVCSEAAQMGCFNLCYYGKIRGPGLEAVFLSPPVRASWSWNRDVLSSCKHCFFRSFLKA